MIPREILPSILGGSEVTQTRCHPNNCVEIRSVYACFTTNYVRIILILWVQIKMYTQIIIKQRNTKIAKKIF